MRRRFPQLRNLELRDQIIDMVRTGSPLEAVKPYIDELCERAMSAPPAPIPDVPQPEFYRPPSQRRDSRDRDASYPRNGAR